MNVSIIVPCFNEAENVVHLAQALDDLQDFFSGRYELEFVLVDDGSTDGTYEQLARTFRHSANCSIVSHARNQGITAAIMTGLRHARAEIACSIDSDCTYHPRQLAEMIPMLCDDVDMVTASPYHPRGAVEGTPAWRLWLSRCASHVYRMLLRQKLSCYTSCFRVYRRSAVAELELRYPGFVGVTELLWRLERQGSRVVEAPALLTRRKIGISKMNTLRTMRGHVQLMSDVLLARMADSARGPRPVSP